MRATLGLIIFTLLLGGLALINGDMVLLALPFVLYVILSLLQTPESASLAFRRDLSAGRIPANTNVTVTITVTNNGRTLPELHVIDNLPPDIEVIAGAAQALFALPAGASHTFTYTARIPRGSYTFSQITAIRRDPFGLRQRESHHFAESELLAFLVPRASQLKQIGIHPRRTRVYAGNISTRVGGLGTDFFGTRPYQHGDTLRRINWRASARHHQNLITNEYEQERVADVGIILDARMASNLPHNHESLLEYSIEAVTIMMDTLIDQGNRVALLIYGGALDYTLPGYGRIQKEKILQSLSAARLQSSHVFAELRALPTQLFPAKSQIVFVSPLLPEDTPFLRRLRAYDYQVLLVSPNPLHYSAGLLPGVDENSLATRLALLERDLLLSKLLQAGIFVLDWDVKRPFTDVARPRLRATAMTKPI